MDKVIAFIDASNLFYGGVKSLGWKIDYHKLLKYLKIKYKVDKAFYYAGVDICDFPHSGLTNKEIHLEKLLSFLSKKRQKSPKVLRSIKRIKFYRKLKKFGYFLRLKPVKIYRESDGTIKKKANCDVDMTFDMMRLINKFSGIVFLSGDGDFVVILKYLLKTGKKITVLSRGERTAKEIKQLAAGNFSDFYKLRKEIEFKEL